MIAYLLSRIIVLLGIGLRANTAGKDMMLLFAFMVLPLQLSLSSRCYAAFSILTMD